MSKTVTDADKQPATQTFTTTPEVREILIAARKLRPFDSLSEIIREYILVANQVIEAEKAKTDATVTEIEAINV